MSWAAVFMACLVLGPWSMVIGPTISGSSNIYSVLVWRVVRVLFSVSSRPTMILFLPMRKCRPMRRRAMSGRVMCFLWLKRSRIFLAYSSQVSRQPPAGQGKSLMLNSSASLNWGLRERPWMSRSFVRSTSPVFSAWVSGSKRAESGRKILPSRPDSFSMSLRAA